MEAFMGVEEATSIATSMVTSIEVNGTNSSPWELVEASMQVELLPPWEVGGIKFHRNFHGNIFTSMEEVDGTFHGS